MIAVKNLLRLIRHKQKDNNEIKFSDYDILQALNECLRYVNQRFSLKNADFLEKIQPFVEDDINAEIARYNAGLAEGEMPKPPVDFAVGGVELPEDFLVLVSIARMSDGYPLKVEEAIRSVKHDTYKIVGSRLYCGSKAVNMLYRFAVPAVKSLDGFVQLPDMFVDGLVKCTGMILNNTADTDVMAKAVDANIVSLVNARRYSNAKVRMPFIV